MTTNPIGDLYLATATLASERTACLRVLRKVVADNLHSGCVSRATLIECEALVRVLAGETNHEEVRA